MEICSFIFENSAKMHRGGDFCYYFLDIETSLFTKHTRVFFSFRTIDFPLEGSKYIVILRPLDKNTDKNADCLAPSVTRIFVHNFKNNERNVANGMYGVTDQITAQFHHVLQCHRIT